MSTCTLSNSNTTSTWQQNANSGLTGTTAERMRLSSSEEGVSHDAKPIDRVRRGIRVFLKWTELVGHLTFVGHVIATNLPLILSVVAAFMGLLSVVEGWFFGLTNYFVIASLGLALLVGVTAFLTLYLQIRRQRKYSHTLEQDKVRMRAELDDLTSNLEDQQVQYEKKILELQTKSKEEFQELSEKLAVKCDAFDNEWKARITDAKKLRTIQMLICKLAYAHAHCDKGIFDNFNACVSKKISHEIATANALTLVDNDIQNTLDSLSQVLKILTGDITSCCIKSIRSLDPNGTLADAVLWTTYRDSDTEDDGDRVDNSYYTVRQNSVTLEILVNGSRTWGNDDLKSLGTAYVNARPDWNKFYNATLGVGIRAFEVEQKVRPLGTKSRDCAVLGVDNKRGGLNNTVCKEVLRSFSWRLAVMLYRLRELGPASYSRQSSPVMNGGKGVDFIPQTRSGEEHAFPNL